MDNLSNIPGRPSKSAALQIAVFGGGVAGLTAAAALHARGYRCRVYERRHAGGAAAGMGIVLAAEAVAELTGAGLLDGPAGAPGVELHRYRSYHPDGTPRQVQDIPPGWRGLPRGELIEALQRRLPPGTVVHGAGLAALHLAPDGTVASAGLATGEPVRADLYLAADGAHSLARRTLYPDWPQRLARVRELVGLVHCPPVSEWAGHDLRKFQQPGVSIGILPCGGGSVGWFMQFDSEQFEPPDTAAAREEFAHRLVGGWADPVPELLRATDFPATHVWHPIDADLVPRFHSGNLALLGDAAHPLLPFTSQGVGTAIADGRSLAATLAEGGSVPDALAGYATASRSRCAGYVGAGRELTRDFLATGPESASRLPLAAPGTAGPR